MKYQSIECETCQGEGYEEIVECSMPASMCCGGCVKTYSCEDCNGNGTIEISMPDWAMDIGSNIIGYDYDSKKVEGVIDSYGLFDNEVVSYLVKDDNGNIFEVDIDDIII